MKTRADAVGLPLLQLGFVVAFFDGLWLVVDWHWAGLVTLVHRRAGLQAGEG